MTKKEKIDFIISVEKKKPYSKFLNPTSDEYSVFTIENMSIIDINKKYLFATEEDKHMKAIQDGHDFVNKQIIILKMSNRTEEVKQEFSLYFNEIKNQIWRGEWEQAKALLLTYTPTTNISQEFIDSIINKINSYINQ